MNAEDIDQVEAYESARAGDYAAVSEAMRKSAPIHDRMGLSMVHIEPNAAVITMELGEEVRGRAKGSVHGGMLATFADVACAVALNGAYDLATEVPVTTDMHIRYYRQPQDGPLTAEANVVHRGRRLLSAECSISDARQQLLARSTATYMIVPLGGD